MSTISDHLPSSVPPNGCVGVFYQWNLDNGTMGYPFRIYYDEVIYIGRDFKKCHIVIGDPIISNKHVRIYTIIFDHENPEEVAPLVYAQDLSSNGTRWNNNWIEKSNGSVLLSDGDILTLSDHFHLVFRCETTTEEPFDEVQRMEIKGFQGQYIVTKRKLGSGAYGQVHMAINKKTGRQLACKIVDIRGLKKKLRSLEAQEARLSKTKTDTPPAETDDESIPEQKARERIKHQYQTKYIKDKLRIYDRESEILGGLCHPNIIRIEQLIKTPNTIYMFQDLVTAGDLFSFLEHKRGKLRDIEAAVIVRQILIALDYLHERNIVHRDLKPDNILMTSLADGCRVILTDFGCARVIQHKHERMRTLMGTFEYVAPEVVQQSRFYGSGYTKAVDLWSLGCVTVVLLTGGSPFMDPDTCLYSEELARKCNLERLKADEKWICVGERPKDFVYRLLVRNEDSRMNAKKALEHQWFTNPAHKEEFELLYERAIKDWKLRPSNKPILLEYQPLTRRPAIYSERDETTPAEQFIETSYVDQESHSSLSKCNRSHPTLSNIALSSIVEQAAGSHDAPSPTLSDTNLPLFNRSGKEVMCTMQTFPLTKHDCNITEILDDPNGLGIITTRLKSHIRLPYSPEAWFREGTHKSKEELPSQIFLTKNRRSVSPKDVSVATGAVQDWASRKGLVTRPKYRLGKRPSMSHIYDLPEEDEVYEEVENAFSGARCRVLYGRDIVAKNQGRRIEVLGMEQQSTNSFTSEEERSPG